MFKPTRQTWARNRNLGMGSVMGGPGKKMSMEEGDGMDRDLSPPPHAYG